MPAAKELLRERTLQDIEANAWGEPTFSSSLVIRCHALRRKPLKDFSPGDMRVMIGQEIGLPYLLPMALEALVADPLVEGDYFPGDLLLTVLRRSVDELAGIIALDELVSIARRALAMDGRELARREREEIEQRVSVLNGGEAVGE